MSMMPPPGGPPPGMGAPPMGQPPGPPMGAPPAGGGSPVQALSGVVAALDAQQQMTDQAATSALMLLAQALGDQASPQAVDAQSSPGPMLPQAGPVQ